MSRSPAFTYLEENYARFQNELIELVRIPSISIEPDHDQDIKRAANWLAEKLRAMGVEHVGILPTAGHPVVYGDWLHGGPNTPTVLIYGHYDVQFPQPLEDWKSEPFAPEIREEDLYGRGVSDMKGQVLAALNAVEAILKTEKLPMNVKFLLEGEEEIGSKHLNEFLTRHRQQLASDYALTTDAGGMPDPETPSICYSLRGGVGFVVDLFGPSHDIHSGEFGGTIQNPIHVMAQLIAGLHDENGHVSLPGFYDKVRKVDGEERAELAGLPFDEEYMLKHSGAPALWGEPEFTPLERTVARPTAEILHFAAGAPKSAIPAKATARFSFRLVPDQVPEQVQQSFRIYVEANLPPTVTARLESTGANPGILLDRHSPEVQAMKTALQAAFGKAPILQRGGGGIGAVGMFKKTLGINTILTGFSLPDDNFHGPNEKLHLPTWKKGMAALVHFFQNIAKDEPNT
jgi:acetylornithine deacetylase/succinyl-diaminopimelate desuccinylase-like protein